MPGDENFDHYNTERLRAADTLLLSGRTSFLGNKDYWSSVPNDPNATVIRREFAGLIKPIEKVVISDHLTREELAPWENTRIVKRADDLPGDCRPQTATRQRHRDICGPLALE